MELFVELKLEPREFRKSERLKATANRYEERDIGIASRRPLTLLSLP